MQAPPNRGEYGSFHPGAWGRVRRPVSLEAGAGPVGTPRCSPLGERPNIPYEARTSSGTSAGPPPARRVAVRADARRHAAPGRRPRAGRRAVRRPARTRRRTGGDATPPSPPPRLTAASRQAPEITTAGYALRSRIRLMFVVYGAPSSAPGYGACTDSAGPSTCAAGTGTSPTPCRHSRKIALSVLGGSSRYDPRGRSKARASP